MTAKQYIKYLHKMCKSCLKDPVTGTMDDWARNSAYESVIASIEVFEEKYHGSN